MSNYFSSNSLKCEGCQMEMYHSWDYGEEEPLQVCFRCQKPYLTMREYEKKYPKQVDLPCLP